MYAVQKKVPIPKMMHAGSGGRHRVYPFDILEVGDMFFVPYREKNNLSSHASHVGKQSGKKFRTLLTTMYEDEDGSWVQCDKDHEDAVIGIGVWRTE